MPLESTQAGWYVTVGFDAAQAMLIISAKMLDKSVPFIIGPVVPETMDRLKERLSGSAWRHVPLGSLEDVGSSGLSAHQMAPPS